MSKTEKITQEIVEIKELFSLKGFNPVKAVKYIEKNFTDKDLQDFETNLAELKEILEAA